jgi:CBS domain-containing protein
MIRLLEVSAAHVMTLNPAVTAPDAPLGEAAGTMLEGGFRHLPVVDADQRLVGMIADRDLRAVLGVELERLSDAPAELLDQQVERAMRTDPIAVGADATLREVVELLSEERIGAVPVTDEAERLVGIVSYVDVLRFLREHDAALLFHSPPPPARVQPARPPARDAGAAARPAASRAKPAVGPSSRGAAKPAPRPAPRRRGHGRRPRER